MSKQRRNYFVSLVLTKQEKQNLVDFAEFKNESMNKVIREKLREADVI